MHEFNDVISSYFEPLNNFISLFPMQPTTNTVSQLISLLVVVTVVTVIVTVVVVVVVFAATVI